MVNFSTWITHPFFAGGQPTVPNFEKGGDQKINECRGGGGGGRSVIDI